MQKVKTSPNLKNKNNSITHQTDRHTDKYPDARHDEPSIRSRGKSGSSSTSYADEAGDVFYDLSHLNLNKDPNSHMCDFLFFSFI